MKKYLIAIVVVVIALAVFAFIRLSSTESIVSNNSENIVNSSVNGGNVMPSGITLQELAQHNTADDCWVGYNGKVYDVTSWLPRHPGSAAAIRPYCGTYDEFTEAFTQMHGTSKANMLMNVGTLMGDFQIQ